MAGGALDGLDLDAAAARRSRRSPSGIRPPRAALERLLDRFMPAGEEVDGAFLLKRVDLCHLGFWLGLGAYFLDRTIRGSAPLGEAVLSAQFADGGWNCQMRNQPAHAHSSFHTTFNVLENLRIAADQGAVAERAFRDAEARRSSSCSPITSTARITTGEVISERFTHLTYPWHWHYTFLRGLDYLRLTPAIEGRAARRCDRAARDQRKPNGRWPLQKRIPGTLLVEMEKPGRDSRWNTLRALRILRRRATSRLTVAGPGDIFARTSIPGGHT